MSFDGSASRITRDDNFVLYSHVAPHHEMYEYHLVALCCLPEGFRGEKGSIPLSLPSRVKEKTFANP